jgi:Fe-Mn family superoxide dismutase
MRRLIAGLLAFSVVGLAAGAYATQDPIFTRQSIMDANGAAAGAGVAMLKGDKLVVMNTPNGENPLVHGGKPLLGVDVWEHSYYIDYRNRRPDYLKAFVEHLVNWDHVDEMFAAATK